MQNFLKYFLISLILLNFTACTDGILSGYKIDIQQGNVLMNRDVSQLAMGMSTQQVQDLLGTPILRTLVEPEVWNYVYTYQKMHQPRKLKKLILQFKNDSLVKILRE